MQLLDPSISPEEMLLITRYRKASAHNRRIVYKLLDPVASPKIPDGEVVQVPLVVKTDVNGHLSFEVYQE